MTGPLDVLFAQVREESALLADWAEEPLGMGSVDVDNVRGRLLEALSSIERHVQDMETALRPFVEEYDFRAADYLAQRVDGEEARVFTARTVDLLIEHQRAARAALPAREKEEER